MRNICATYGKLFNTIHSSDHGTCMCNNEFATLKWILIYDYVWIISCEFTLTDGDLTLNQIMAWCQEGNKPIPANVEKRYDTTWFHKATMSFTQGCYVNSKCSVNCYNYDKMLSTIIWLHLYICKYISLNLWHWTLFQYALCVYAITHQAWQMGIQWTIFGWSILWFQDSALNMTLQIMLLTLHWIGLHEICVGTLQTIFSDALYVYFWKAYLISARYIWNMEIVYDSSAK